MPNEVPLPPVVRIYIDTQSDCELVAQSRQAVRRSLQILAESRSVIGQLRFQSVQATNDCGRKRCLTRRWPLSLRDGAVSSYH